MKRIGRKLLGLVLLVAITGTTITAAFFPGLISRKILGDERYEQLHYGKENLHTHSEDLLPGIQSENAGVSIDIDIENAPNDPVELERLLKQVRTALDNIQLDTTVKTDENPYAISREQLDVILKLAEKEEILERKLYELKESQNLNLLAFEEEEKLLTVEEDAEKYLASQFNHSNAENQDELNELFPREDVTTSNSQNMPSHSMYGETTSNSRNDLSLSEVEETQSYDEYIEDVCRHDSISYGKWVENYKKYNDKYHKVECYRDVYCTYCDEYLETREYDTEKEYHDFKNGKCKTCGYKATRCTHENTYEKITYWTQMVDKYGEESMYYTADIICEYCEVKVGETDNMYDFLEDEIVLEIPETEAIKPVIPEDKEEETTTSTSITEPSNSIVPPVTSITPSENQKPVNTQQDSSVQKTNNPVMKEWINIDPYSSVFQVDGANVEWQAMPIVDDYTFKAMIPLRQISEILGWEVDWDEAKRLAIVSKGNKTKYFKEGIDVLVTEEVGKTTRYQRLENIITNRGGMLYADLDAVLDATGYSYYTDGMRFFIRPRKDVIELVSAYRAIKNYDIIGSKSVASEVDFTIKSQEAMVIVTPKNSSFYYTVIVPAANQSLKGNYYEGKTTFSGIIGQVFVGELPGVGTVADIRDLFADFQNWEWSWTHAGQTILDGIGIIPLVGALKYSDEAIAVLKGSSKIDNAVDGAEVAKLISKTENVDDLAKVGDEIVELSIDAAKAAIKNVDDLKALAKNPDIYADGVLEHIFMGNSKGGFHYNGLNVGNAEVVEITKPANKYGIYEARVQINGKSKKDPSSFFPDDWTPQKVLDVIDEAYYNGAKDAKRNIIIHELDNGMSIQVNLNESNSITSAFPKYQ